MSTISIKEIQEDAATVVHRLETGERFIVTMGGRAVAELHPLASSQAKKKRPYGLAAGQFVVLDDFDAPLSDEILDSFEGK